MSYHEDHLATEIGPFGQSADAQDPAFTASEVPDIERKRPDDPKGLSRPDPAQGRQRPPGVELEPSWPDIREFSAQSPSQEDYPLAAFPDSLRAVLESAAASCGASVPTTAACLLGSLATLAQHDFAVRLLAPRPVPLSLSIVAVSESGWRKSTVGELLMSSHVAADTAIARIHARAKASLSPRGGRSQAEDEIKPRRHSPIALRYDITTEGLLSRLEGGRPTQALFNTEAGIQIRNWSFSGSQKARTLGVLNNLWDGTTTTFDRTSAGGREYRISQLCPVHLLARPKARVGTQRHGRQRAPRLFGPHPGLPGTTRGPRSAIMPTRPLGTGSSGHFTTESCRNGSVRTRAWSWRRPRTRRPGPQSTWPSCLPGPGMLWRHSTPR